MLKVIDPITLLTQPKEVMIIDLLSPVSLVPEKYLNTLIPPTAGIYIKGRQDPVIDFSKKYYKAHVLYKSEIEISSIDELLSLKSDLINEKGDIVFQYDNFATRADLLTYGPSLPIVAIRLAKNMILERMFLLAPHTSKMGYVRPSNFFKEGYSYLADEVFDDYFEGIFDDIFNFVHKDNWFMYTVALSGTSLIVEKIVDYRIYVYHDREFKEHIEEEMIHDEGYLSTRPE